MIDKPKWYSNLKEWREANGCVGELWDIYAEVTREKVKEASYAFFLFGIAGGISLSAIYVYFRS